MYASAQEFGRVIKYLRERRGYTQDRLCELTGLHKSSVSDYENGKRLPKAKTLEILAEAFRMNPQELVEFQIPQRTVTEVFAEILQILMSVPAEERLAAAVNVRDFAQKRVLTGSKIHR